MNYNDKHYNDKQTTATQDSTDNTI